MSPTNPPGKLVAPAKLNLCLYLGELAENGLHRIVSLFEPIDLVDHLQIDQAEEDEVDGAPVIGKDLTARALEGIRRRGLDLPPLRVRIEKKIPVAAGMGGGSADAAAVLRYARPSLGEDSVEALRGVALEIGSDVLAQSGLWSERPNGAGEVRSLVSGTGDRVEPAPAGDSWAGVVIASKQGLSTPEVYAEADRLGLGRSEAELEGVLESLRFGSSGMPLAPLEAAVNDLQPAAISLRPELEDLLGSLLDAGARNALVTGSGPTVFGVFQERTEAERAAERLASGVTGKVLVVEPLAHKNSDGGVG